MTVGIGLSILIAMFQSIGVSGNVPAGVGPSPAPGAILWLPAEMSPDDRAHECALTAVSRWTCPSVPGGERGVAVILGDGVIGYVVVGRAGAVWSGKAEWGRLVRIAPGGIGAERLGDLRVSPWTVDRPASRPNTLKLDVIPDTTLQVIKVSDTSFWVSGPFPSTDAFLRLDGPGIAQHDITTLTVASGPPGSPFVTDATNAVSIIGRVEARSGEPVEGALIELFAKAPGADDGQGDEKTLAKIPVIRLATVVADGEGRFELSGLENGTYQIAATAFSRGRLTRWTTTESPPLLMKLEPPARATGRVVRHKLPAAGVKVRFVPASAAWRNSSDPSAHLTSDVSTDQSGRFALALPPQASGDVQFIAPDGASMRITLPALSNLSEVSLGDVSLPERIAVEIRADVAGCLMTAIGPSGALGLGVVRGRATATIYQFDLPEPGEWFLDAECSGRQTSIQPPAIQVKSASSPAFFDVRIVTTDGVTSPR
jgi:hypothetical protein